MAQIINVDGVGALSFPDGMSDEQIAGAIHQNLPNLQKQPLDAVSAASARETQARLAAENGPSAAGAFFREAGRSVGPGAAGFAGGMGAGALAGMAGGPFAPITVPVAALVGGLTTGMATRKLQDITVDAIAPNSFAGTASATQDYQTQPLSALLGGVVATGRFAPFRAAGAIKTLATQEGRALLSQAIQKGAPPVARAALNDVVDVAAGTGIGAGMSLATGNGMVLENAGAGLLFNRSYFGGRRSLSTDTQPGQSPVTDRSLSIVEPEVIRGPVTRMGNGEVDNYSPPQVMPMNRALPEGPERGPVTRMGNGEVDNYSPPQVMPMNRALPEPEGFSPAGRLPAPAPELLPAPAETPLLNAPAEGAAQSPAVVDIQARDARLSNIAEMENELAANRERRTRLVESFKERGLTVNKGEGRQAINLLDSRARQLGSALETLKSDNVIIPPAAESVGNPIVEVDNRTFGAKPGDRLRIDTPEPSAVLEQPRMSLPNEIPSGPVIELGQGQGQPESPAPTPLTPDAVMPAPVVGVTEAIEPLKGSVSLAKGRLTSALKQLSQLEAAGKKDTNQYADRKAYADRLAAQIKAAGAGPESQSAAMDRRISDVHKSEEYPLVTRIAGDRGFVAPDRMAGLIESNKKKGAKLSEKNQQIARGFGETRDDAARKGMFGTHPGGELADAVLGSLHSKSPNAQSVDEMAHAYGMSVPEFHAQLNRELSKIAENNGPRANAHEDAMNRMERQHTDFHDTVESAPDRVKATPEQIGLERGDTLKIDGEPLTVIKVDDESVTLRDHDRFGDQKIPADLPIPADNVESQAKARIAEEAPGVIEAEAALTRRQADEHASEAAPKEDFTLKAHQSDAEIKAELTAAKQKEELAKRQTAPLKGSAGDLTPDIFGEGETPLFNERRDATTPQSFADNLRDHQSKVRDWVKGEQKSGRMNSMPIDLLGAQAYDAALSVAIKALEAGHSVAKAVKAAISYIKSTRSLTPAQEREIASHLEAEANKARSNSVDLESQFTREMPKIQQDLIAQGKVNPTMNDLISALVGKFPDQAKYIRANGPKIFDSMMFEKVETSKAKSDHSREWLEWTNNVMDGARNMMDYGRKGVPIKDAGKVLKNLHGTFMTGIGSKMHMLADGTLTGKSSKALGEYFNKMIGLKKGADGVHQVGINGEMEADVSRFANKIDAIARDINPFTKGMTRSERTAFAERIGDHLTDPSRDHELASQPELKRAVDKFIALRKELLDHMKAAGVDVGDAGRRTMRRVLNRAAILGNEGEFIRQAAKAYDAKWSKEISSLKSEADVLKARGAKGDAERFEAIQKEIAEIQKRDSEDSAKKYFHAITTDDLGISSDGNDLFSATKGNPSILKSREFGPEADQLLGKFYQRNPFDILGSEVTDAVRAAGVAKAFAGTGVDGKPDPIGGWKSLREKMIAEGNADLVGPAATLMKEYFNIGGLENKVMRRVLEVAHTHTQIARLSRAVISSLGEPALVGIRSGSIGDMGRAYKTVAKEMVSRLRGASPSEMAILAEGLGLSADGFNSITAGARLLDTYGGHGNSGKLVSWFHSKTLLTDFTNATHVACLEIGRSYLRTQMLLVKNDGKLKTLAGRNLNELGITGNDIPELLRFADKLDKSADKLSMLTADTREAKLYRDALHLFKTSGGSMTVTRGSRPQYANSPVGGLFYSLQSFMFAFNEQVTMRHARLLKAAYDGHTQVDGSKELLSGTERAKIVGDVVQGLAAIGATQYAVQLIREYAFGDPERIAKDKRKTSQQIGMERLKATASRSSLMGGYDVIFNMATNARYDRDPATALMGPAVGGLSELVKLLAGQGGAKDSDNTNTAERKLMRRTYDMAITPMFNAAAATMPGRAIPFAVLTAGSHAGTREQFIKKTVGPPTLSNGPLRTTKRNSGL